MEATESWNKCEAGSLLTQAPSLLRVRSRQGAIHIHRRNTTSRPTQSSSETHVLGPTQRRLDTLASPRPAADPELAAGPPLRPRPRPAGAGAAHPLTQSWPQFRSQLRLSARLASRAGLLLLPHLVLGLTPPRGCPWGPWAEQTRSLAPPHPGPPRWPHRAGHAHRSPSPGCSRRSCRPRCPRRPDWPRSQTGRPASWCHPLCGQSGGLTAWPRRAEATLRPSLKPRPLTCCPSARAFWRRRP